MKIAVNLTGVAGQITERGPDVHGNRNWETIKHLVKSKVIDCWLPDNEVEVYFTTYTLPDSDVDRILDFFKPRKHKFLNYEFNVTTQRATYAESLRLLLDSDVDFIVSTRFDIEFVDEVSTFNIDFEKVNFLFREAASGHEYVNDVIFMFPKKYLISFIVAIEHLQSADGETHMHDVYRHLRELVGEENMHVMYSDTAYLSFHGGNTFYKIYK